MLVADWKDLHFERAQVTDVGHGGNRYIPSNSDLVSRYWRYQILLWLIRCLVYAV